MPFIKDNNSGNELGSIRPTDKPVFNTFNGNEIIYNIFLPTVKKEYIFGGIYTALLFLKELQVNHCKVKITAFDKFLSDEEKLETSHYLAKKLNMSISYLEILTIAEYKKSSPSLGEIFIGTIWYTTIVIRQLIDNNDFIHKSYIYFIQDFEPGFSQWSDDYADAITSYKKGRYIPVFNSTFLKDYFAEQGLINFDTHFVLKPQIQTQQLTLPTKVNATPKLFFYARPKRPRNLFKTGMQGLIDWLHEENPDIEIYTAGQPHDDLIFGRWTIKSLGKMDESVYWKTLSQYDIGLSLMLSPHPSYPPLEMALSGVMTVTNRYANKDLAELSNNFVSCDLDSSSVKQALKEAYGKCKQLDERIANAKFDHDPMAHSMEKVAQEIVELYAVKNIG